MKYLHKYQRSKKRYQHLFYGSIVIMLMILSTRSTNALVPPNTNNNTTAADNIIKYNPSSEEAPKYSLPPLSDSNMVQIDGKNYYKIESPNSEPFLIEEKIVKLIQLSEKYPRLTNNTNIVTQLLNDYPEIIGNNEYFLNQISEMDPGLLDNSMTYNQSYEPNSETTSKILNQNPDYAETLKDTQHYFKEQWVLENDTHSIPSDTETSYETSIINSVFQKTDPYLSHSQYDNASVIFEDNESFISVKKSVINGRELTERSSISSDYQLYEKTLISDEVEIKEKRAISGHSRIVLEDVDISEIDNITIPVVSKAEATDSVASTVRVEKIVNIGFNYRFPGFDWDFELNFLLIRFHAWARFHASLRFVFPVKLIIEYPSEVIQGQPYSFTVKLIPIDRPNYNEFDVSLLLDIGFSIDHIWLDFYWFWHYFWYYEWWPWSCFCWKKGRIRLLGARSSWRQLIGYGINFGFESYDSYKTPLWGQMVTVLDNIPLELDIFDLL
ncbi:MAG: hypothetical protein ACXAC7_07670, partial [Candidatus Hodarchaeales archaeon]